MTTAHRPTFDHAKGKETDLGAIVHTRMLPGETKLKFRQPGQGGESAKRELLEKELFSNEESSEKDAGSRKKRKLLQREDSLHMEKADASNSSDFSGSEDDLSRIDLDENDESKSDGISNENLIYENEQVDDDDEDDEDDDDENEEELLRQELEKIRQERAEQKRKTEEAEAKKAQKAREKEIAFGNPLLNREDGFKVKRSWTDETVFKNQASSTNIKEDKLSDNFINDMVRSDFHKKFISKYIQ